MQKDNNNSPHILNAASNLLGLCFIVLTSIKLLKLQNETYIDDVTAVAFMAFMLSSLLSFLSIRSNDTKRSKVWENIAEYVFLSGLLSIFIAALIISTNVIR